MHSHVHFRVSHEITSVMRICLCTQLGLGYAGAPVYQPSTVDFKAPGPIAVAAGRCVCDVARACVCVRHDSCMYVCGMTAGRCVCAVTRAFV